MKKIIFFITIFVFIFSFNNSFSLTKDKSLNGRLSYKDGDSFVTFLLDNKDEEYNEDKNNDLEEDDFNSDNSNKKTKEQKEQEKQEKKEKKEKEKEEKKAEHEQEKELKKEEKEKEKEEKKQQKEEDDIENDNVYFKYTVNNEDTNEDTAVIIKQDGEVVLESVNNNNQEKTVIGTLQLTYPEFINLKSVVNDAKMFSMENYYDYSKYYPYSYQSILMEFHYYDKIKRISLFSPYGIPNGLFNVLQNLIFIRNRFYFYER